MFLFTDNLILFVLQFTGVGCFSSGDGICNMLITLPDLSSCIANAMHWSLWKPRRNFAIRDNGHSMGAEAVHCCT